MAGVAAQGNRAQRLIEQAKQVRKALVGLAALLATVAASGFLSGTAEVVVGSILAVLGVFGIYQVPGPDPAPLSEPSFGPPEPSWD